MYLGIMPPNATPAERRTMLEKVGKLADNVRKQIARNIENVNSAMMNVASKPYSQKTVDSLNQELFKKGVETALTEQEMEKLLPTAPQFSIMPMLYSGSEWKSTEAPIKKITAEIKRLTKEPPSSPRDATLKTLVVSRYKKYIDRSLKKAQSYDAFLTEINNKLASVSQAPSTATLPAAQSLPAAQTLPAAQMSPQPVNITLTSPAQQNTPQLPMVQQAQTEKSPMEKALPIIGLVGSAVAAYFLL